IENDAHLFVTNSTFSSNLALGGNNSTVFSNDLDGAGFAQGGALDNEEAGLAILTGNTFDANQSIGGDGNSGIGHLNFVGAGLGGAISSTIGGGALGVPTLVIINGGTFDANEAIGGNGNTGSASAVSFVGAGLGGMIWNDEGSIARISDSTIEHNQAL